VYKYTIERSLFFVVFLPKQTPVSLWRLWLLPKIKNEQISKEILQQNDQLVFVQNLCDPKIATSIFNRV